LLAKTKGVDNTWNYTNTKQIKNYHSIILYSTAKSNK